MRYVAGRVHAGLPSSVEFADLVSDGVIGLLDAIDKFDLDRGVQFQTYAVRRVRGAILDGLRSTDWVPRSVRDRIRDVKAAVTILEQRLARPPEDDEIAAELGMSVADLREVYAEASHASTVSMEESWVDVEGHEESGGATPGFDDGVPPGFLAAVAELPERDQIVIALYYWDRLTLAEIGQVLGVTESRVSQLHSRATLILRDKLAGSA